MRLFFCEKCGKRLDDRDLDSGAARDKKLKGVYCAECSVGVNTMVMQPISDADLRRADPAKPPSDANLRRAAPHAPSAPVARRRPAPHGAPARPEFETKKGLPAGTAMIFIGVGVLAFALLFLFRSSSSSSSPGRTSSVSTDERKSEPAAANAATRSAAGLPKPPTPPAAAVSPPVPSVKKTADQAPATSPLKTETGNPALEKERTAQAAFDKVLAETDPKKDKAQAVDRMQAFVDAYPESVVAARGRSLLAEWSKPEAPPPPEPPPAAKTEVAVAVPEKEPAENPAADDAGPAPEKILSGRWETLNKSVFTGPDLDDFWQAGGNAEARFENSAWRVDTTKQVHGKYLVSARAFPLDRVYRLKVSCGYRGDSPNQWLMIACLRAEGANFLGHGIQNRAPMVVAQLSANELALKRMHDKKMWSREDLMKPAELPQGEHQVEMEIDPKYVRLSVDGKERFSGAHGLKDAGDVKFQLLGIADTFPRGEEIWFRSVKLESAPVASPSQPPAVK